MRSRARARARVYIGHIYYIFVISTSYIRADNVILVIVVLAYSRIWNLHIFGMYTHRGWYICTFIAYLCILVISWVSLDLLLPTVHPCVISVYLGTPARAFTHVRTF